MQNGVPVSKKLRRYSLGSLMFIVACFAGYLTGYRLGHKEGMSIWDEIPIYIASYDISDINRRTNTSVESSDKTLDDLATQIKSGVIPASWVDRGGNGFIEVLPAEGRLVIATNSLVHEEVRGYLKAIRRELELPIK